MVATGRENGEPGIWTPHIGGDPQSRRGLYALSLIAGARPRKKPRSQGLSSDPEDSFVAPTKQVPSDREVERVPCTEQPVLQPESAQSYTETVSPAAPVQLATRSTTLKGGERAEDNDTLVVKLVPARNEQRAEQRRFRTREGIGTASIVYGKQHELTLVNKPIVALEASHGT